MKRLEVSSRPQPPSLESTFKQAHLVPSAVIGVRMFAPEVAEQRLKQLREMSPPAAVPEERWDLYVECEAVQVVWREMGARDATWEAPPSPHDAVAEYLAWQDVYAAWQRAESVSLAKRRRPPALVSKPNDHVRQPAFIHGGTLFAHQLQGANWLWRRWRDSSKASVLADEAGLGKTVQAIAFLLMVFHSSADPTFPFLVVVPARAVGQWAGKLRAWAPELVVAQLSASAEDRMAEPEHMIFRGKGDLRCHVVLASHDAATTQMGMRELANGIRWEAIVCDEAKADPQAKTYKALATLDARMRVMVLRSGQSGLPSVARFAKVGESDVLCRAKADVGSLESAICEVLLPVAVSRAQREMSRVVLAKSARLLQRLDANAQTETLVAVQRASNHLSKDGGKLRLLRALVLEAVRSRGQRMLVFARDARMLDSLEALIADERIGCVRIDAATPPHLFMEVVD
ncbi:hypothetical protein IWW38_005352, partial [Coemansia aciculifera]